MLSLYSCKSCNNTFCFVFFFLFLFLFFVFVGLLLWHVEFLRLGVKSEPQMLTYATATAMPDPSRVCDPCHSSWQCQMSKPPSKARDGTRIFKDPNEDFTVWIPYTCFSAIKSNASSVSLLTVSHSPHYLNLSWCRFLTYLTVSRACTCVKVSKPDC